MGYDNDMAGALPNCRRAVAWPTKPKAHPQRRRSGITAARKPAATQIPRATSCRQEAPSCMQGYNCQLAVDSDHQVIVAVGVSNQSPDFEHLEPMLERIVASAGALPDVMTLDAGYWSENNVNACADQGIDAYIATGRLPHGQKLPPKRGQLPRDANTKTRMARKLRSKKWDRGSTPSAKRSWNR